MSDYLFFKTGFVGVIKEPTAEGPLSWKNAANGDTIKKGGVHLSYPTLGTYLWSYNPQDTYFTP